MTTIKRGFTLIELLVVIAIIGVLSSVVLASLNAARGKARDSKRLSDLTSVRTALEIYANDNGGRYPVTGGSNPWWGICTAFGSRDTSGPNGWVPNLAPTYIPALPTDPKPIGSTGCYIYQSDGQDYILLAFQTVETYTVSTNRWLRPSQPTLAYQFAFYTAGAASW